jgi:hypothetical protein
MQRRIVEAVTPRHPVHLIEDLVGFLDSLHTDERSCISLGTRDSSFPNILLGFMGTDYRTPEVGEEWSLELEKMSWSNDEKAIVQTRQRYYCREVLHIFIGDVPLRLDGGSSGDRQVLSDESCRGFAGSEWAEHIKGVSSPHISLPGHMPFLRPCRWQPLPTIYARGGIHA